MKNPNFYFFKMTIVFAVALFFSFNSFSQTSTVIRGPYLQSGTSTSTIVKWRTSNSTDSQVWYGTDVNNLNQTVVISGSQTDHQVTVSGLVANTIYYYAIGDSGGQMEGGNGDASHYFKTAPIIGSSQSVTAWILGDCGTANNEQQLVRDAYYNYIGNNHTDMVLLLGDNAYDDGFDNEYQTAFFDVYPDKLKNSISWSCPGNHDYFGSGLNNAYYDIFSFPTSGEAGGLASNTEKYYSFDYANIHIVSLDSHDENRNTGSPMLTWLENDLAATTQEWIIVMFHHPPYSKGSHDSDDTSEERMIEMRENVLPICESYGVDLVLSGHSHAYERSKLINGHYGFSNTYDPVLHDIDGGSGQLNGTGAYQQNTSVEGTVYVVTGSAGGSSPVGNHPVMYFSKDQVGSTILEVDGSQMDVKFLNENGVVEDSLTLVQNGQPVINWTNPSNGNIFINLNSIALNVDAFDNNGNIAQIEYFVNGVSIGIDVVTPYSFSWTPPSYGSYLLKATATDNEGNSSSKEISITIDNNPTTSIAIQINDGDDDAEESSGDMILTSSDLELVEDGQDAQTVGLVFNGLNIPTGAIITNAYIQFTTDETYSVFTNLTIHGEDTDNSLSFTSSAFNLTSRPTTAASVSWIPLAWSSIGEAGINQQTPDLSTVIQEIVDRSGWVENNSMGFIISGVGTRTADSYDGSTGNAAILYVTFSFGINSCEPFFDVDNDGFCSDVDCDDTNGSVYPSATEICDGIDNNCNGQIDEGAGDTYFADTDSDGFGHPSNSIQACSVPTGYVSNNTDCNDTDPNIYIGATCDDSNPNTINDIYSNSCVCVGELPVGCTYETIDNSGFESGWGIWNDGGSDSRRNINDSPYASTGNYCIRLSDNSNSSVMTTDVLNLSDFEELTIDFSYYVSSFDSSNEDFWLQISTNGGSSFSTVEEWNLGDEFNNDQFKSDQVVLTGTFSTNTVLRFRCDASNNNDLVYIDDVTISGCNTTSSPCEPFWDVDNDGFCSNVDCDDTNSTINSGAIEICDGLDNNCDGQIDEGVMISYFADTDSDGFGDPNNSIEACSVPAGYISDNTDCDDSNVSVNPSATEICDGVDNNCDGQIDEGLSNTYFADTDSDGFGDPNNSIQACSIPTGYVSDNTDCDDTDPNIYIGATCDDSDPNTINDIYDNSCVCLGEPTVGCIYGTIDNSGFESDWGIWNDGGSDSRRSINDSPYASTGNYSIRLRDNSSSSVMTTDVLDLSNFEELTIDFSYYVRSFDNSNEDFWLQISTNGGSSFSTIEEWNLGDEFNNDQFESDQVIIAGTFSANTVLRFRCDASNNGDQVYIDDVAISGCNTANSSNFVIPSNEDRHFVAKSKELIKLDDAQGKNTLHFFPNPVRNQLIIHYEMHNGQTTYVELIDLNGRKVVAQTIQMVKGHNEFQMDLSKMPDGLYFLRVMEGENHFLEKVVISK